MILLEIKNIHKFNPIKWESNDLSTLTKDQSYIRFAGDHPDNPEHGSVVLSAKVLEGNFNDINNVLFIGDDAQDGKLLNCEKKLLGGYRIEIQFNTIFGNGLKYSAMDFIQKGGAIVGLTQTETESLNSIIIQKRLLSLLAAYIIPSKSDEILKFAKQGFLCIPNNSNDENISHFLGYPKNKVDEIKDSNDNSLFHLASIKLDDFPVSESMKSVKNVLSFYLRTNDTDKGWPEDKSDFRVLNHESFTPPTISQESGIANNMEIKVILDLPSNDHSILHVLNFTEEEKSRYNVLRSIYMKLMLHDQIDFEVNKLFGYPDSIQNCVAYEAERVFNNREYSDEIYKDAADWTLLLQVSPYCKKFSFFDQFGDGTIYYLVKNKDLAAGNFDHCQVIVQNT